ncbi:MAG: cytosine deaminase [Acetobacteraceae bacterium]|nr:cytosine deaminase [Acetobacteraceae bacterium]
MCTPISTRATSGRAAPIPTAPSWARSRRCRTIAAPTGRPRIRARASTSACAAPTPTERRRSAPISTPTCRTVAPPGACSPTCATFWAGRIDLQASSICPIDRLAGEEGVALADLVADHGGVLGFVTRFTGQGHDAIPPGFQDLLDRAFGLAEERGLDLDLHVDESGETAAATLPIIARTAIRRGFRRRIQVGHICSLSLQPDAVIEETIRLVRDAGIAVVSLPMCNMYLQDRVRGRTPRWRGVTLLHELAAAGVPVSVASDNCRDPFYAYGDHDMVEVFQSAVRIAHLDAPLGRWPEAVTTTPAEVMGLAQRGRIRPGAPADFVLFRARFWHELLARRQADRIVVRSGRAIDTTLPDYRELDALVGLTSG